MAVKLKCGDSGRTVDSISGQIVNVFEGEKRNVGYGVTANIAASHNWRYRDCELPGRFHNLGM